MRSTLLIIVIIDYFKIAFSIYDPCSGKSALGGACGRDGDCDGFGLACKGGTCQCHPNFEQKSDPDSKTTYCQKLPDAIGASCSSSCQPPLFCNGGKCQCIRSKTDGNRCYSAAVAGDSCSKDTDCGTPFMYCAGSRCACVPGSTQSGSSCTAAIQCPTGARAKGSCVTRSLSTQVIQNYVTSGGNIDNCPSGSYCYAPAGSYYGSCCPEVCPLSGTPDTSYSCDPTAQSNKCPDATHYCHRAAGQSYSSTVCCRRPCREPNPIYVKGQCYPRAFLGSPCQVNEQCDGGYGMQCSGGVCRCTSGFTQYSDGYTTGENPPQICVRDCGTRVSHGGECFSSASLQGQCTVNEQCPSGAACFRGACFCDCRKGFGASGSSCVKKATQTSSGTATGTGTSGGATSGNTGSGSSGTSSNTGGPLAGLFGGKGGLLGGGDLLSKLGLGGSGTGTGGLLG